MIIFNNYEYNSFKELREKDHLVSEYEITKACRCWWKTVRDISDKNNFNRYSVIANGKDCFVYDESIIDFIHKIKPIKNEKIPDNYITRKELIKYLGITSSSLRYIEFWCWAFKDYKKTISGKICYKFDEEAKDFYNRKIYKWRHPDRLHGTCWQR
jgi:hypothetical protein